MNREEIREEWNKQKAKLLKRFSVLTEDDLFFREGRKDEMLERLQLILVKNKDELNSLFEELKKKN
jgi:hypothetical protein